MLIRALTLLSVLVAGAAAPAVSQSATGRIVGRVLDVATGEPIPGAHVAITALGISGRSDLTGRYTLWPGNTVCLHLDQELAGKKMHWEKVEIRDGQLTMTDFDGTQLTFDAVR